MGTQPEQTVAERFVQFMEKNKEALDSLLVALVVSLLAFLTAGSVVNFNAHKFGLRKAELEAIEQIEDVHIRESLLRHYMETTR